MPTLTTQQLESLERYTKLRDDARNGIAHGVYPNILQTLDAYDALVEALQGELSEWAETHSATTAAVAPHIATLRQHLEAAQLVIEQVAAADDTVWPSISATLAQAQEE